MCHSVIHPTVPGEKLFMWLDPTHNLKNLFNNWCNKIVFHLPAISAKSTDNIKLPQYAKFSHCVSLHALEETKALRVAFSLNNTSLKPNNIQKTSPKHALSKYIHSVNSHYFKILF